MKKIIDNLNCEQLKAVMHNKGPCLVIAGPGSGKTTVIAARVLNLIKHYKIDPTKILVVTFSKASANEMKERFKKYSDNNFSNVSFGTFHSIFFRILQNYKGYNLENLMDETEKIEMIKSIIRKYQIDISNETEEICEIINEIGYVKNTFTDINTYQSSSCKKEQFKQIFTKFEDLKEVTNKFDYDDMLLDCYYLLKDNKLILEEIRNRYQYINVDEFQDINPVQFQCIKLMTEPINNIFVVGDDDQSIYSFRGADPYIMLDFETKFKNTKKIILNINYRSTKQIVKSANQVINCNKSRFKKIIDTSKEEGISPVICHVEDFEEEAKLIIQNIKRLQKDGILIEDMAAIYRTNLQARTIIDALVLNNIQFTALDGLSTLYNHWIYSDILAYLNLAIGYNKSSLLRIINKPKRYISREVLSKYNKSDSNILDLLARDASLNNNQINLIIELKNNINRIKSMNTNDAIQFIRKYIGYDDYLKEYSLNKGMKSIGLLETAEDIEISSKPYNEINDFLEHISNLKSNLYKVGKQRKNEGIQLLTMHKAKGLEYEVVFVAGCIDGLVPYIKNESEKDEILEEIIEEERRLFYVAMTRAKQKLYIISPKYRYNKRVKPSRFLKEIVDGESINRIEIKENEKIYHKIFGEGIIEKIFPDDISKMLVNFNNVKRELNIETCLKNRIIKMLKN